LIVPRGHALARKKSVPFEATLESDYVGLHSKSSISLAMRDAAAAVGRNVRLRIQVTGLDAMYRMIQNGMGIGVMPHRAFTLMNGAGNLDCVRLTDAWAIRRIELIARDFSTLPVTARLLVDHLQAQATEPVPAAGSKR